jgi:thiosulfate dehydrogenase
MKDQTSRCATRKVMTMGRTKLGYPRIATGGFALLCLGIGAGPIYAHKEKHTAEQLKAFDDVFMEQVKIGDLLFHGDEETQKRLGVTLSKTGTACAMCHPYASDTHPYQFPKFQEQMNEFATLRDMINWCIEKPSEGEKIDVSSPAMKALETYIIWSNKNSKLDPGTH